MSRSIGVKNGPVGPFLFAFAVDDGADIAHDVGDEGGTDARFAEHLGSQVETSFRLPVRAGAAVDPAAVSAVRVHGIPPSKEPSHCLIGCSWPQANIRQPQQPVRKGTRFGSPP